MILRCVGLYLLLSTSAFAGVTEPPYDLGAAKPYALIQLGDGTGLAANDDDDNLDITSNSSIFGSTLKGLDNKSFQNKLSTSKIIDNWDAESGVSLDKSSSFTGDIDSVTATEMQNIIDDVVAAQNFWDSQTASSLNADALDGISDITLNGGGVYDVTGQFKINGQELILDGDEGDFYVFNIKADQLFLIDADATIRLEGDIDPSEVLFNVLGNVDGSQADASINSNSLYAGTVITQRNLLVQSNHFYTFESSGFPSNSSTDPNDPNDANDAPSTAAITYEQALYFRDNGMPQAGAPPSTDSGKTGGLFGQLIAAGKITWSESDLAYYPFMEMPAPPVVPEPSSLAIWSLIIVGGTAVTRRRQRRKSAE